MRDGAVVYLDVKSAQYTVEGAMTLHANRLKASQIEAGVKRLNVYPDGQCALVDDSIAVESTREPKHCLHCAELFRPTQESKIYCSPPCRAQAYQIKVRTERGIEGPIRKYTKRK